MQTYLVGGAVRDSLLGLPITERDWVVVGSSPEEMLKLGYRPVGKDFPVFLHPKTHEEYALARTERKSGKRHGDFTFNASPEVTLEQDLLRRDLTINAMAKDIEGNIIDPYGGQKDIAIKVLRHVSAAFSEDPLRVLRVARFMAKFAPLGFTIAAETLLLMQNMVANGELEHLSQERVWQEVHKALKNPQPQAFFTSLQTCQALAQFFPYMTELGFCALEHATKLTNDVVIRLAAACYEGLPQLKMPNEFSALIQLVVDYHKCYSQADELSPTDLLKLYKQTDALRRPERFNQFLMACSAIHGSNNSAYLASRLQALQALKFEDLAAKCQGKALADQIDALRLQTLSEF